MLWGYGMHTCFSAHINRAVIPASLKPLIVKTGLRRAADHRFRNDSWWNGADTESVFSLRIALGAQQKLSVRNRPEKQTYA
jgi:hypothetical protein